MINSIETIGLRVESVTPSSYSTEVNINSKIELGFNSELNTDSIFGNFAVLLDKHRTYEPGKPVNINDYDIVEGTLTYKDKSIFFTPNNQLYEKARYIIYVKGSTIRDIVGRAMLIDYISYFDTEGAGTLLPCEVVNPANNSIISSLDKVELQNLMADKYILQISKVKTFEVVVYDNVENTSLIEKDFKLGDGLYYIRAKAVNGDFGETSVFTIRSHKNTAPTDDDLDEDFIYEPYVEELISLQECVPSGINISEKSNVIYMKFKGEVTPEMIDMFEVQMYGELSDDDDYGNISEHGELDGSYSIVYDDKNDETYIFFIPKSM